MALKGPAQHWYTNIPKGHIHSWHQLRSKLLYSFHGLKPEELMSCDFHNCKQGEKETLHEYMQHFVKLCAKAPNVEEGNAIDVAIIGLRLGPCGEYLDKCKPWMVRKLFDIMQEYCKSNQGRRRRLEALNEEKKARTNQWSQLKPWHTNQPKQHNKRPCLQRARNARFSRFGKPRRAKWLRRIRRP